MKKNIKKIILKICNFIKSKPVLKKICLKVLCVFGPIKRKIYRIYYGNQCEPKINNCVLNEETVLIYKELKDKLKK